MNNSYSQNNLLLVFPNSLGIPLHNDLRVPSQNNNLLLQNNSSLVQITKHIGVPGQNNTRVPVQNVVAAQKPIILPNNFTEPFHIGLSSPVSNSLKLPAQNNIAVNTGYFCGESMPLFVDVKTKTEENLAELGKEELSTNFLNSRNTCKVEVKSEPSDPDDNFGETIYVETGCSQLKVEPPDTVTEEPDVDVKVEPFDSYVMNNIENTHMQSTNQDALNETEPSATVKEEETNIEVKEEPFDSYAKNDLENSHIHSVNQNADTEPGTMDRKSSNIALRKKIIALFEAGMNKKDISKELCVTRTTVHKWIARWKEEGDLRDHQRTGAQRKTTPEQDRDILHLVKDNPFTNARQIKIDLNLEVSDETVRKRLNESRAKKVKQFTPAKNKN